jgi:hypothetical protein
MRILLPDHVKRMGANHSAVGRNSDERTTGHAGDGSEIGPERSEIRSHGLLYNRPVFENFVVSLCFD